MINTGNGGHPEARFTVPPKGHCRSPIHSSEVTQIIKFGLSDRITVTITRKRECPVQHHHGWDTNGRILSPRRDLTTRQTGLVRQFSQRMAPGSRLGLGTGHRAPSLSKCQVEGFFVLMELD